MPELLIDCLLWFGAVGCGMVAGIYFAFSTFIMTALGRIEPAAGIRAMNSINSTILQSLFMPFFIGTTVVSAVLSLVGGLRLGEPDATPMLAGGLIYVVGMFGCTMLFNVPLNNELVAGGTEAWSRYLKIWTRWNHVRTISSALASIFFIAALCAR